MTCRHMYEEQPSGMCFVCAPWMFPTPEQRSAYARWFDDYRYHQEVLGEPRCWVSGCTGEAQDGGLCSKHTRTHGAPRQVGVPATDTSADAPAFATPAASPPEPDRAAAAEEDAWQELAPLEQDALGRIVDEGDYGYDTDDLGPRLMPAVRALQAIGYVGIDPDTGRWVAGRHGRFVAALRAARMFA